MKIKFVDLAAQYASIKQEIDDVIARTLRDSSFIGGAALISFEKNFALYADVKHCIGVGNGTDALFIALKMLGIRAGDEVIVPANSFIATSETVTLCGAKVVFADCDKDTYTIDPGQVQRLVTPRTKAIIPVHLYGQPADMDPILDIARTKGLHVIEDAAQAHGSSYKGRKIGSLGTCGCFSFFPGKNLGAYGDAGALVTSDDALASKARMFANHGRIEKYNHEIEGINSRLDGLQAAILDVKLKHLETWTERRIEIARRYTEAFRDILITPKEMPGVRHVYHLYVLRVRNRDQVVSHLFESGIATGVHYPIALPLLKAYHYLNHQPSDFPVASAYQGELLSIPIHGSMTDEQVNYVITEMKNALKRSGV